jgi:glycine/D-amino acid oxidase-like deaminating enzyme
VELNFLVCELGTTMRIAVIGAGGLGATLARALRKEG